MEKHVTTPDSLVNAKMTYACIMVRLISNIQQVVESKECLIPKTQKVIESKHVYLKSFTVNITSG